MWACFPLPPHPANNPRKIQHVTMRADGFTLIEILVVMLVMALLAGLVAPNVYRSIHSYELHTQRQAILAQLGEMSYRAYLAGQPIALETSSPESVSRGENQFQPELPPDWIIETKTPIHFSFTGVCLSGGEIALIDPDGTRQIYTLAPPRCRPES